MFVQSRSGALQLDQVKHALRSCDRTSHRDERTQQENVGRYFGEDLAQFVATDIARRPAPE
ncbi:MAG: hypothetical protein LC749_00205 [Actinobacteria bacterium]|nr:hypothetical protein [Actinomycetota bacterium]